MSYICNKWPANVLEHFKNKIVEMLPRLRLKKPKFLLILFVIIFFLVFFVQQFNYEESDNSYQFKQNHKLSQADMLAQIKKSHLGSNFNHKYRNKKEESVHLITKAIDTMKRLVHLDLKGSQPKLAYLTELIPYFKRAGATGVLIEYEDFFPYENDLEAIRNQNHYTKQELSQILKLIKDSNLDVIPLIQTYGHLEFVLKLKQFDYLREDKKHFQAITPCLADSYEKVLFRMIDQILENHPDDIEYIHIGCDEVYHMNEHPECSKIKDAKGFGVQDWFILHVSKIVEYIKTKRPYLNVIIWDDMIRRSLISDPRPSKKLTKFAKSVVPMVWDYKSDITIDANVWKTYDEVFNEIWVASAFKGATQNLELVPNATMHYNNQLSWLSVIASFKNPLKLKGIAITGWSRYDHMQSVCEIISAAIPSLTLCLQTFTNYDMDENIIFSKSKYLTQCSYNKSKTGFVMDPLTIELDKNLRDTEIAYTCNFPGANIYKWLFSLKLITQKLEKKHSRLSQILNEYNLKNNFFNTLEYEKAIIFYTETKEKLMAIEKIGEQEFDKYFYSDLYEEIIQVYIYRYVELIDRRLLELSKIKLPESAPNRPFNKISLTIV